MTAPEPEPTEPAKPKIEDAPIHTDRRTPEQIAADRAADQYEASLEGDR